MGKRKGIPGLSFSWKRAVGISAAKSKVSRMTGIPLTKGARQRKIGAATGCCIPVAAMLLALSLVGTGAMQIARAADNDPPLPCDWTVTKRVDPMTDMQQCMISSTAAQIALAVNPEQVRFLTGSAYQHGREGLQIRVDSGKAVFLSPKGMTSAAFEDDARIALRNILAGQRIRTAFRDYPQSKEGDAQVCTLPQMLRDCGAPMDRIMDTRTQGEIIRQMTK